MASQMGAFPAFPPSTKNGTVICSTGLV
ncbi:hypothetical protein CCACVL1_05242 [Corchorus capsularis]|uniref:Uncharacterized protein n=1 Tax=Corchorus capsularis TaxID=210143 RepID=A0A1R3JLN8_COCAP|nr:hypothetical protein CCACVL1_05242 [Corchorus capsularis]